MSILSFFKRGYVLFKEYVIEIGVFLFIVSELADFTLKQDLFLEKACRVDLGFSPQVCLTIKNISEAYEDEEKKIQKLYAKAKFADSFISYGGPIMVLLILGPISDLYSWKLPLLMSSFGNLCQRIFLALAVYFDNWSFRLCNWVHSGLRAIGGGEAFYLMAAVLYITSSTNDKNRTIRLGILYFLFFGGVPVGTFFGTQIMGLDMDLIYIVGIAAIPSLTGFLLIIFFVKNKRNEELSEKIKEKKGKEKIVSILSPDKNFFKVLKTIFRPRDGFKRGKLLFMLFSHSCMLAPLASELGIVYLFLRLRLGWELEEYGNYYTYLASFVILGTAISTIVFKYWLELHDAVIGLISALGQFSSCIIFAITRTVFLRYLGATLDMFNSSMLICNKSLLSNLVDPAELGDIFSFLGVVESSAPFILAPIYNLVYEATLDSDFFSGTFYLISATLTLPIFFIYGLYIAENIRSGHGIQTKSPDSKKEIILMF